jgi:hypothetical protein
MNRRDFMKGLSLLAGAAVVTPYQLLPVLTPEELRNHPDNPWRKRDIESGYSKLRITGDGIDLSIIKTA